MRNKNATFEEISKKFKLSSERVRQIVTKEINFCLKHYTGFKQSCVYCITENDYKEKLSPLTLDQLIIEGKKLSLIGKTREDILKKRIFTNIMRDSFGCSFSSIGRILDKDHTTIMNLYYR